MYETSFKTILETLSPLAPLATQYNDKLDGPEGIKAILFDVYGTLLVTGIGDISTTVVGLATENLANLFRLSGFSGTFAGLNHLVPETLEKVIEHHHHELRNIGVDYPEVDIREIWAEVLNTLWKKGILDNTLESKNQVALALRYEIERNPVWPMPGFPSIIRHLRNARLRMGIVSNAQFYTPVILEFFADSTLMNLGFEPEFCAWSYKLYRAKPSPDIFSKPLNALKSVGISPEEVLFIGNDMLNDITTAASAGCRTCLFAGDKRSLRLRENDHRIEKKPDMVITNLSQLECLIVQEE